MTDLRYIKWPKTVNVVQFDSGSIRMSKSTKHILSLTLIAAWMSFVATPAFAYVGPGAGLGAIGTFLAVIGSVLLLIVGFIWYPIKRLIKGKKAPVKAEEPEDSSEEL